MNFGSLVHKQHVCGNCVTACRSVHLCCDGVLYVLLVVSMPVVPMVAMAREHFLQNV